MFGVCTMTIVWEPKFPPVASALAVDFTGEDAIAFFVAVIERGGEIVLFFIRVTGIRGTIFPLDCFFFILSPFKQTDFHFF